MWTNISGFFSLGHMDWKYSSLEESITVLSISSHVWHDQCTHSSQVIIKIKMRMNFNIHCEINGECSLSCGSDESYTVSLFSPRSIEKETASSAVRYRRCGYACQDYNWISIRNTSPSRETERRILSGRREEHAFSAISHNHFSSSHLSDHCQRLPSCTIHIDHTRQSILVSMVWCFTTLMIQNVESFPMIDNTWDGVFVHCLFLIYDIDDRK